MDTRPSTLLDQSVAVIRLTTNTAQQFQIVTHPAVHEAEIILSTHPAVHEAVIILSTHPAVHEAVIILSSHPAVHEAVIILSSHRENTSHREKQSKTVIQTVAVVTTKRFQQRNSIVCVEMLDREAVESPYFHFFDFHPFSSRCPVPQQQVHDVDRTRGTGFDSGRIAYNGNFVLLGSGTTWSLRFRTSASLSAAELHPRRSAIRGPWSSPRP